MSIKYRKKISMYFLCLIYNCRNGAKLSFDISNQIILRCRFFSFCIHVTIDIGSICKNVNDIYTGGKRTQRERKKKFLNIWLSCERGRRYVVDGIDRSPNSQVREFTVDSGQRMTACITTRFTVKIRR